MASIAEVRTQLDIKLIGDLPIFCGADSADVEGNPELFRGPSPSADRLPTRSSVDGQLWGHPHYRWSAHRKDHFSWWTERVKVTLDRISYASITSSDLFERTKFPGTPNAQRQK